MPKKKAIITHCSQCPHSKYRWIEDKIYVTECEKIIDKPFLYYSDDEEMGNHDTKPYSTPIPDNCPLEDAD